MDLVEAEVVSLEGELIFLFHKAFVNKLCTLLLLMHFFVWQDIDYLFTLHDILVQYKISMES